MSSFYQSWISQKEDHLHLSSPIHTSQACSADPERVNDRNQLKDADSILRASLSIY